MIHHTMYTVGHGNRTFAELLASIEEHGVRTIIDVRSEPYSRHAPDFSRPLLDEEAATAGIGYRWFGEHLGGRPTDPRLRGASGRTDWDALAVSPGFSGAADEVAELGRGATAVLLCAEGEPDHCHRSFLLGPAMEQRGFDVVHILRDGSLHSHQTGLFPPGD